MTDEQLDLVEPLLPAPKVGGRPEKHPRRSIVDGILYVVRTGCAWRYLPADFPPWQTVYWYFKQWERDKVTDTMLTALREQLRVQQGRSPQPSAGIIDSQSVKGAGTAGRGSRGYDAGKKINDRKRFIVTDTLGLLIVVVVLAASVQDRDGAKTTLLSMYLAAPIRFVFADAGFAGRLVDWAAAIVRTILHVVRKPEGQQGFAVIPRRWCVERTMAWLTAHRRLARDYERDPATSEAIIRWAAINTMTTRITRGQPGTRQPRWRWPDDQ
ncbi:IS5 family transposase [Dactylosporangium sp. NPDC049140]|uniref:IS5 family transposase n=1 Tax=Dactylosporangium sp. NPDC049140 TaxID=3155647 RepID=UPI0033EA4E79